MLQFAERALRFVSRASAVLAMVGMSLLVILFTASILLRMVGTSIPSVDDLGSILIAAVFGFGLAAAVGANEHLSITLLVEKLPPRPRRLLSRATEFITIAVAVYLFNGVFHLFTAAIRSNQKMLGALPIPRYLPMSMVVLGVGLFAIALILAFIRNMLSREPAPASEH